MKTTESFDDSHNITLSGATSGAASRELRPGDVIGGSYKLKSLLGRGGMGYVFCAEHTALNIDYALKMLAPEQLNDVSRRRFEIEGRAIAKLDHPNIVKVHNMGLDRGDCPFYVMDLLPGKSLADYISEGRKFSFDQLLDIFIQIASGLGYAHSKGIVHRDVKPSNVCILEERGMFKVKIVDFGIAKLLPSANLHVQSQTSAGEVFGSPLYMSPEQGMGGQIDHRSDMYSLGCTFFEAITGRPPFRGENPLQTILMHQDSPLPSVADATAGAYPVIVDQLLNRMMAKRPSHRYQSMQQLIHDLERLADGKAIGSASSGTYSFVVAEVEADDGAPSKVFKTFAAGAGLLAVVAVVALVFFLRPSLPGAMVSDIKTAGNKAQVLDRKRSGTSLAASVPDLAVVSDPVSVPTKRDIEAIEGVAPMLGADRPEVNDKQLPDEWFSKAFNADLVPVLKKEKSEIARVKKIYDASPPIVSSPVTLPNGQKGRRFVFPSYAVGKVTCSAPHPYDAVEAVSVQYVADAPLILNLGDVDHHIVFYVPSMVEKIGDNEFSSMMLAGLNLSDESGKQLGLPSESAGAERILRTASHWKKLEVLHINKLNVSEGMLEALNHFPHLNILGLIKNTGSFESLSQQPFLLNTRILVIEGLKNIRPTLATLRQSEKLDGLRLFDCGLKPDDFRIIEQYKHLHNFQIQEEDLTPLLPELAKLPMDLGIGGPKLNAREIHLLCEHPKRQRVVLRQEFYSDTEKAELKSLEFKVSFEGF